VNRSKTPSLRSGGAWISAISAPRSRSRPARHACSIRFASSTCSRLASGSAWMPTSPRRLVTAPSISSRIASASVSKESRGTASEPTTFNGKPASEPGVYTSISAVSRSAAMRSRWMPLAASPSLHCAATVAAYSSTDTPAVWASSSLTHGLKLSGARSGNVRRRFPMSPFGSRINAGTPETSASSRRTTPRPVLREPVIPTMTAWVVRSAEGSVSASFVACPPSTRKPRLKSAIRASLVRLLAKESDPDLTVVTRARHRASRR
jgi:hypothetical protein